MRGATTTSIISASAKFTESSGVNISMGNQKNQASIREESQIGTASSLKIRLGYASVSENVMKDKGVAREKFRGVPGVI